MFTHVSHPLSFGYAHTARSGKVSFALSSLGINIQMYSLWKKKKEEKKGQQNTELGAYFVFRLNPEAPLSGRKKNNLKTMNAAA